MLYLDDPFLTAYCAAVTAILGACMGSFLNCMAWRLVHGESVLRGRSHCDACGHVLGAGDLIPIVSYVVHRGRCRYCGAEAFPGTSAGRADLDARLCQLIFFKFYISLKHSRRADFRESAACKRICGFGGYIIRTDLSWPVLSFYGSLLFAQEPLAALQDALLRALWWRARSWPLYCSLKKSRAWRRWAAAISALFMTGTFLGLAANIVCLLLSCLIGIFWGLAATVGKEEKTFPWGPSIAIGAWLALLFGNELAAWYLGLLAAQSLHSACRKEKGKTFWENSVSALISESSVKMVLVAGTEIKSVTADLPDHMVENGSISRWTRWRILSGHRQAHHLPKAEAAVILPASTIFVRTITVPVMTEQQLFNLPFEFKDYLTEEKRNYLFDYAVLEDLPDEAGQPHELRLLACAVHKEIIEAYRSMFKRAGFKLKLAVPQECAYTRSDPASGPGDRDPDCCIADIGHSGTRLHLFHQREYATVRNVDIGMRALDEIIAAVQEVDVHMAHTCKESNYNQVLESDDTGVSTAIWQSKRRKAVNFFNYNNRNAQLEDNDIYLCGGGMLYRAVDALPVEETPHTCRCSIRLHGADAPLQRRRTPITSCRATGLAIGEKC